MSAFLGPIHHWLFNKISLQEQLENNIITEFKECFGKEAEIIANNSVARYGEQISSIPLENQIDLANIHHWLQSNISKTETRLAYIIGEELSKHGDKAFEIVFKQFSLQGENCGMQAKAKGAVSAPLIYKALNDYLLEGMPCDRVNVVTESTDDLLVWETTECLHKGYWQEACSDIASLYTLRFQWIKSFVSSANPDYEFVNSKGDNINSLFINEIRKKS